MAKKPKLSVEQVCAALGMRVDVYVEWARSLNLTTDEMLTKKVMHRGVEKFVAQCRLPSGEEVPIERAIQKWRTWSDVTPTLGTNAKKANEWVQRLKSNVPESNVPAPDYIKSKRNRLLPVVECEDGRRRLVLNYVQLWQAHFDRRPSYDSPWYDGTLPDDSLPKQPRGERGRVMAWTEGMVAEVDRYRTKKEMLAVKGFYLTKKGIEQYWRTGVYRMGGDRQLAEVGYDDLGPDDI